jgi:transcriptional regulator with XRE-family HTH domain
MPDYDASAPDPLDVALGARLGLLRRMRGLSQAAVGAAVGLTFQQIQKYERGANRVSASMLVKLAQALEVTVGELFAGEADPAFDAEEAAMLLMEPGALRLLRSYCGIPDGKARQALAAFARELAG